MLLKLTCSVHHLFVSISWAIWITQAWPKDSQEAVQNFRNEARELIRQAKAGNAPDRDVKYEKAISALQQAIRLDERSSLVTSCSFEALFESLNRYEGAAQIYQQALL